MVAYSERTVQCASTQNRMTFHAFRKGR
jgi:hypothetical protein